MRIVAMSLLLALIVQCSAYNPWAHKTPQELELILKALTKHQPHLV